MISDQVSDSNNILALSYSNHNLLHHSHCTLDVEHFDVDSLMSYKYSDKKNCIIQIRFTCQNDIRHLPAVVVCALTVHVVNKSCWCPADSEV